MPQAIERSLATPMIRPRRPAISFETRTDVTVERYRSMVARKTGALIAASAEGAAVLATDDQRLRDRIAAKARRRTPVCNDAEEHEHAGADEHV